MRYWFRELGGWVLILLGFLFFNLSYRLCLERNWMGAFLQTLIGIFVFRGGIHLLKIAVAARICQQAQDRIYPVPPPSPREVGTPTVRTMP